MNKIKFFVEDLKKVKWKNMKTTEKKFIIMTILFLLGIILTTFILSFSIYAEVLGYPKEFNKYYMFDIQNFKIYRPNKLMLHVLKQTPQAKILVQQYIMYILIILTVLYILLGMPIDYSMFRNTSYGNARWANWNDLGYSGFIVPTTYAKAFELNLLEETGVVLGEYNGRILYDNAKTHILLSAPTRTGKGVAIIIPTLVTWVGSIFVLDVKGENYEMTAGYRQKYLNNKILKFSPKSLDSCHYNPLSAVRYLTDREKEDIKIIADLIVVKEGAGGGDPFWDESGSDFMSAVIMWAIYDKRGKGTLADVVEFITDASAPIADRMADIIEQPMFDKNNSADRIIMEKLKTIYPTEIDVINEGKHPLIIRGMASTLGAGEKTMASIVITAKTKLSVFEMPTVKANTAYSDFEIEDLLGLKENNKPISLYLCIEPGDLKSLAPLIRILTIQIVTLLSTPEILASAKNRHRLLMLLDEFPTIGKMDILEKGIGFVAGYGMKMMLVVQSLDQLNSIYGKDNAFPSNSQVQIFYTANENQTAEYVSKTIGNKTIKTYSYSGDGKKNINYQAMPLVRPEEVRRFPLDKIMILVAGKMPIKAKKILFFSDKRFKDKIKMPIAPSEALQNELKTLN